MINASYFESYLDSETIVGSPEAAYPSSSLYEWRLNKERDLFTHICSRDWMWLKRRGEGSKSVESGDRPGMG